MKTFSERYKYYFTDKRYVISVIMAILLTGIALVVNFYAGIYALEHASGSVTDIILSNIPVFDVDPAFVFGPVILVVIVSALCLWQPRKIPFVLKSIALFILIRSVFVVLTHIGPYPSRVPLDSNILKYFTSGYDLFFSGHTGLPFLLGLIFWKNVRLRVFFILSAIFFGIVVLLGHLHYSIDVLSAFFITYTIYHIAEWIFRHDRSLFYHGL